RTAAPAGRRTSGWACRTRAWPWPVTAPGWYPQTAGSSGSGWPTAASWARCGTHWRSATRRLPSPATRSSPATRTGWCTASGCRPAPRARVLADERVQRAERGVGLLDLRQVPGLADDRELRVREGRGQGLPVPGRDDPVAVTPEHQDRDLHPAEEAGQPGVVHIRVAGEDAHGRHVGGALRGLLRRHGGRVDV